jgi:hypothetical protein
MKKPFYPLAYPEAAPGGWTVDKIRDAITSLENGYPAPAARLVRAMGRHPRYVQGRDQFIGAVMGCPMDVLASPVTYGGKGTARRLAQDAAPMLGRVLANGVERWLIEWGKMMPLVVGYLPWDTVTRPWAPVSLIRWPLDAIRIDLYTRQIFARMLGGQEVEVIGGDGTWFVWWPYGEFNMAAGLVRCLGEPWIRGVNASRDVANRSQASSVAALVQEVPAGEDMEAPMIAPHQENLENLQRGGRAGIMTPPGWPAPTSLDLATKNAQPTLELALQTSTTDLIVPWLMQDGTSTNAGGSLAKAQVLDGVLFSAVAGFVASLWGEVLPDGAHVPGVITSQIVRPWVRYQVDPSAEEGEADRVVPMALRRVPDLEEDARLTAQADRAAAFWTEVGTIESRMRRDMTADELEELATMRGAPLPAGMLKERGARPAPPPPTPTPEGVSP